MSNVTATKKKTRIFYYDALRAFAIIFVILIHTSKWFAKSEPVHSLFWTFSSSLASLGNVGVPIFFMISGALLLNRKYDDLGGFYKKRLSRLFIPFFFWIIFNLTSVVITQVSFFILNYLLESYCSGNQFIHKGIRHKRCWIFPGDMAFDNNTEYFGHLSN